MSYAPILDFAFPSASRVAFSPSITFALYAARLLACGQYDSPFGLSATWARVATRAHIADTPSALAYVLDGLRDAQTARLYPVCAHTARDFIRLLPHFHPINGLAFPENWGSARK
jgi:hypothetical protein